MTISEHIGTTARWLLNGPSVNFPGALKSQFTTQLSFAQPSAHPAMPTYRVMDSDGNVVDPDWQADQNDVAEVVSWYKNMLTGDYLLAEHDGACR